MEFVDYTIINNNLEPNLYSQNKILDQNCYFENRLQVPIAPSNIQIKSKQNNAYSKKYTGPDTYTSIPNESVEQVSQGDMVVNTSKNINTLSQLEKTSQSYMSNSDSINFMNKHYLDDDNNDNNVTSSNKYKSEQFWKTKRPQLETNEKIIRNRANLYYENSNESSMSRNLPGMTNKQYMKTEKAYLTYNEGYTTPENVVKMSFDPYNRRIIQDSRYELSLDKEPNVPIKYRTNYTMDGENNVSHEGQANKGSNSYKGYRDGYKGINNIVDSNMSVDVYNNDLSKGMITYYEDHKDVKFNNEFMIDKELRKYKDVNGNTYNKFVFNNTVNEDLTPHEKNIMLQRNEKLSASINETMRYD